jgi:hypothetical protein
MAQTNDYLAMGREQGAVLAKYLIERITQGQLTINKAVQFAARQAEVMQRGGYPARRNARLDPRAKIGFLRADPAVPMRRVERRRVAGFGRML